MWKFYYDEAFHDRKITIASDDVINIYKGNASDIYTGFFCGYEDTSEPSIWKNYEVLDKKYREVFTIPDGKELKGTTISRQNYNHGFASLKKLTLDFYDEFFDLLNDSAVVFHISMFSKTELIVQEFMRNISFPIFCNHSTAIVIYIVTKFLFNYRNQELIKKMMLASNVSEAADVITLLRAHALNVIQKSGFSKKKKAERNSLSELHFLLGTAQIDNYSEHELSWRYEPIFIGFNKLLDERKISPKDIRLMIDDEERTFAAAKAIGNYNKCVQGNSKASIGIRISDFLAHFFGSLVMALIQGLDEGEIKSQDNLTERNYEDKKLLPPEWFSVTERQFNLWKKIETIICNYHRREWTGYDGIYCDFPALVFALLEYVDLYATFEEFHCVPSKDHCEKFNEYCCKKLEYLYRRAGTQVADY